jgi:hypothetical protein
MARTETGIHTSGSLTTIASALEAIAGRLTRTADALKEKGVASLEIKNQAGLKDGIASLRSFGMAAEEALEAWAFDQNVFAEGMAETATEPAKAKPEGQMRKAKKQQPTQPEGNPE